METWHIKEDEYSHGDLYELIVETTFSVYYKNLKKPIYIFKGKYEAEYNGVTWEQTYASGVASVKIVEEDEDPYLYIEFYKKKDAKIALLKPQKKK